MRRAVVALSGGQDSVTTLAQALREAEVVGAIHFDYGQRHRVELEAARFFAEWAGVPLEVVTVPAFRELGHSGLVGDGDLSGAHPTLRHLPASFVPGRNLVFLTLAAAYAMRAGSREVWTGVCETDYSGYPDCRRATLDALEVSVRLGMDFPEFEIITPLMYEDKAATFARAERLGVLDLVLERSHTCYEGDRSIRHAWGYGCGSCPACKLRAEGWARYIQGQHNTP